MAQVVQIQNNVGDCPRHIGNDNGRRIRRGLGEIIDDDAGGVGKGESCAANGENKSREAEIICAVLQVEGGGDDPAIGPHGRKAETM